MPQDTVQLTLGVYMFCYAAMLLLHGTLSDSLGRRRVVLTALVCYVAGALLAAAAPDFGWLLAARALQGLSAGAGIVVGQAIVRDCYGRGGARAMSYLILVFNLSPALAPIVGGYLAHQGWRAVFLLLAVLATAALALCALRLPETLAPEQRQPLSWRGLARNYGRVLGDARFVSLGLAFSLVFAAQGFLIGAAPDFITNVLGLQETDFAYLFVPLVIGAMLGALFAARKAGSWSDARVTALAYLLMGGSCLANLAYVAAAGRPALPWAVILPGVFTCGLAMSVPAMTLRILARVPQLSGTAASVLGFMQMLTFSLVRAGACRWSTASRCGWRWPCWPAWRPARWAGPGCTASRSRWPMPSRAERPIPGRTLARGAIPRGAIPLLLRARSGGVPAAFAIWIASSGIHQPIRKINNSHYQIFPFRSLPISPEFVAMSSALPTPAARRRAPLTHAIQTALLCSALAHQNASAQVAAETQSAPGGVAQMPAVTVTGASLGGTTEGTNSYTTESMSTATGLTLAPRETPQSVSVVTRQQIEDQGLRDTGAILASAPGISVTRSDSNRYSFSARGFPSTTSSSTACPRPS